VKRSYQLVAEGNFEAFIERLANTVKIYYSGCAHQVPWSGVYNGRAGAARHSSLIAQHLDIQEFVPHEFTRAGDRIVIPGLARGPGCDTGTPLSHSSSASGRSATTGLWSTTSTTTPRLWPQPSSSRTVESNTASRDRAGGPRLA